MATATIAIIFKPALAEDQQLPSIKDPDFAVQKYVTGICCSPTTIRFVGNGDILDLQKTAVEVHLIRNGRLQPARVLKENGASEGEQGRDANNCHHGKQGLLQLL